MLFSTFYPAEPTGTTTIFPTARPRRGRRRGRRVAESAKPRQLTSIPHSRANSWLELMTGSRSPLPSQPRCLWPFEQWLLNEPSEFPPFRVSKTRKFRSRCTIFSLLSLLFFLFFFLSLPREKPQGRKVSLDNFYSSLPLRYWTRYIYIYIITIIKYAIRGSVSIRMDGCTPFSELKFSFAVPGKQAAKQTLISHPLKYRVFICL